MRWLADDVYDWLIEWLSDQLAHWLIGRLIDCFVNNAQVSDKWGYAKDHLALNQKLLSNFVRQNCEWLQA